MNERSKAMALAPPRAPVQEMIMVLAPLLRLLPALALMGCAQFPELEGRVRPGAAAAPYPELVPLDPILAAVPPPAEQADRSAAAGEALSGRLARLEARAARLRGAVLSPEERRRLGAGVPPR